ncbi:MAG TPA: hypothetical protein PKD99_02350 [Sphingopyxis sp.]|nr:hypothetical protein [Sphingopyxis sp.]HMP43918.1 hypothetical protein [Sphingopyxis sp.]HMQ18085.1 hypothetical protein [Sphingopyxis sp.]
MIGDRDPDPHVPAALMALAGGHGRLLWHKSKRWASASFSGSRDEVAFEYFGREAVELAELALAALGESEIAVPGRTVADACVSWQRRLHRPDVRLVAVIDLLLVED